MPVETVRLSQQAKDQLIRLKRFTRIQNWNVLSRWALCSSLAESGAPRQQTIAADSSVEMTWRTFGGELDDVYRAVVLHRLIRDGCDLEHVASHMFRVHLHRGIGYLAGDPKIRTIVELVRKALEAVEPGCDSSD